MSPQASEQKHTGYKLIDLLTEIGAILITIREKAQSESDKHLHEKLLDLVGTSLTKSNNRYELKESLEQALEQQKIRIDAVIEYTSILTEINSTEFPLEKFGIPIMEQKMTEK